ncbi:MAG: class II aldolase/adducin family protein [Actinobacteria bacterium]|nr:class II aldolase/adducin family protein [Actinomycetota bacterium]
MDEKEIKIKEEIIKYGKMINDRNLVVGPGGNISHREGNIVFLTPSGLGFDEIGIEDIVCMDLNTREITSGTRRPTSEVAMHMEIYGAREDVNTIFHTHPPITIGVIGAGVEIKPLFPDFPLFLGKKVPIIEYTTPCTQELADLVKKNIGNYEALTLKKHGLIVVAKNFREAWVKTVLIEETAKMIVAARTLGKEAVITSEEIDEINNLEIEKYRKRLMKDSQ